MTVLLQFKVEWHHVRKEFFSLSNCEETFLILIITPIVFGYIVKSLLSLVLSHLFYPVFVVFEDNGQHYVEEEIEADDEKAYEKEAGEGVCLVVWEHHVGKIGCGEEDEHVVVAFA